MGVVMMEYILAGSGTILIFGLFLWLVRQERKKTDPDANKNYAFFFNRKHEEAKL